MEEKESQWAIYQANPEEYLKLNSNVPSQFTRKDLTQRDTLMSAGFANWSKKEFFTFIRLNEQFGRKDIDSITANLPNKTIEEVKKYAEAFWNRYHKIENGQKYVERIEKGEAEIEKYKLIYEAIDSKVYYTMKEFTKHDP